MLHKVALAVARVLFYLLVKFIFLEAPCVHIVLLFRIFVVLIL